MSSAKGVQSQKLSMSSAPFDVFLSSKTRVNSFRLMLFSNIVFKHSLHLRNLETSVAAACSVAHQVKLAVNPTHWDYGKQSCIVTAHILHLHHDLLQENLYDPFCKSGSLKNFRPKRGEANPLSAENRPSMGKLTLLPAVVNHIV